MLNYLRLFFCTCFFFTAYGQYTVTDQETTVPVPYALVKNTKRQQGFFTDFNGSFALDSTYNASDTLRISCSGYEERLIPISELQQQPVIALQHSATDLGEVVVSAKKARSHSEKLGVTRRPKTHFFDHIITGKTGEEKAVWIPNDYSLAGRLKTISIYLTDDGFPDAHFRVHVYACDPLSNLPGTELTRSNIIASGTVGNEWVTLDMTNEHIPVSETGCFIGIEWFDSPSSKAFKDTITVSGRQYDQPYKLIRAGNGVVLGTIDEQYKYAKNKLWFKNENNEWKRYFVTDETRFNIPDTLPNGYITTINENNLYYPVPCINMEVSFPKERLENAFKSPKKRKLNRLERVEKDLFHYPQSTVSELFASLIKAFEQDEVIYVLKYLCVYTEDQLDPLLEDLSEQEEQHGTFISTEEKQQIIKHLKQVADELPEATLVKTDAQHFELKTAESIYYLVVENGVWKINPYTYRITQ